MVRTDLIPKQRKESGLARRVGALAASCIFHAAFFGLLLWVTLICRSKWMPPKSGSQAAAPSITLSMLVITAPPPSKPATRPPQPERPVVITRPASVTVTAPQTKPITPPPTAPVEGALPVLPPQAPQPPKTMAVQEPKAAPPRPAPPATTPVAKASPAKPKPAAPALFASSYAPEANVLPHPPYPEEAQNLGETGTVVMAVTFNTAGDVAQAEVSQSSGVRLLDANTRSFILTHWHSSLFAGQTVMQPVRYTGE